MPCHQNSVNVLRYQQLKHRGDQGLGLFKASTHGRTRTVAAVVGGCTADASLCVQTAGL